MVSTPDMQRQPSMDGYRPPIRDSPEHQPRPSDYRHESIGAYPSVYHTPPRAYPPRDYTYGPNRPRRWARPDIDLITSKDRQIAALKSALAAQKFIDNHSEKDCKIADLEACLEEKEKEITELKSKTYELNQDIEDKEHELKELRGSSDSFDFRRRQLEGIIAERDEKIKKLNAIISKQESRMKRLQQIKVNPVCEMHRASFSPEDMEKLKNFDINAPLDDPNDKSFVYPVRPHCKRGLVPTVSGRTPGGVIARKVGDSGGRETLEEPRSSRTRLCTFFALAKCYKDDCHFAHGLRELQPFNVKNYKCDDCMGVIGCLGLDCKYRHGEKRTFLKDGFYLVYGGNLDAPRLCFMPEGDERKNAEEKFHSNLENVIHRLERLLPRKLLPAQIIMVYRDY